MATKKTTKTTNKAATTVAKTTTKRPTAKQRIDELTNLVSDLEFKNKHLHSNNADLRTGLEKLKDDYDNALTKAELEKTRVELIAQIILDRLDGDGTNDLEGLSGKINWWFVVKNFNNIVRMIQEIISVVKK